ncbi:hypothetical protein FIBSPDRAFT_951113 [Athelia psychrophila]|uniref:Uncharacterized protein n=1 Tax=Athelia psychrophila TaxID=1759441 RepID=A0A166MUY9_9AGAM|nr:hypothetical protein FIBSPDRAFT_951113 [Fibularhizoctonia sp. CBS 109695]
MPACRPTQSAPSSGPRHSCPRMAHDNVEVHPEDIDTRIVLRAQVDVLLHAEPKVARLQEIPPQLVFLDLEATLEDLLRFGPADGDVHSDLLVMSDAECMDGIGCPGGDGRLAEPQEPTTQRKCLSPRGSTSTLPVFITLNTVIVTPSATNHSVKPPDAVQPFPRQWRRGLRAIVRVRKVKCASRDAGRRLLFLERKREQGRREVPERCLGKALWAMKARSGGVLLRA